VEIARIVLAGLRILFGLGFGLLLFIAPIAIGVERQLADGWIFALSMGSFFLGGLVALLVYFELEKRLVRHRPLKYPVAAVEVDGVVWVADAELKALVRFAPGRPAVRCASTYPDSEGSVRQLPINLPQGMSVTADGTITIADGLGHCFFAVADERYRRRPAMNSLYSWHGDAHRFVDPIDPPMLFPTAVAEHDGVCFVAEAGNDRILRVSGEQVSVWAGGGGRGFSGDGGPATAARFSSPRDLAFDQAGRLLIVDRFNHCLRRINADGTIETVAGTGQRGVGGDGGPATEAELDLPASIATLPDGSVVIADEGNRRLRKVDADGVISTLLGPDELGADSELVGVGATASGDILLAEGPAGVVRRIESDRRQSMVGFEDCYPEAWSRRRQLAGELALTAVPTLALGALIALTAVLS